LHWFFEEAGRAGDRLTATLKHEREADGKTGTVRPERISRRHDALLSVGNGRSRPPRTALLELDEILKNQLSPGFSSRLHEQTSLCQPPKLDRGEAELFNQGR
jgi:hypothetical protein